MRRLPSAAWIFAPLAIGLLYAAGHALFAPVPELGNLPPADAILVQRFRDLDELDRSSFGPRGPSVRAAREVVAGERNIPGLPGVDHTRPIHMILMPRTLRLDSTMAVFPVSDAGALEDAFNRSDFIERDMIRHAQDLVIRGPWAAIAPNRDDARRMGTGGISAEDLGEDVALAARIPPLVAHATGLVREYPWRSILTALGADADGARLVRDPETGALSAQVPDTERVLRIAAAWETARMWAWVDEGRLRFELELKPGPLADVLGDWHEVVAGAAWPLRAPETSEVWLALRGQQSVAVLSQILHHVGVQMPTELMSYKLGGGDLGKLGTIVWGEPALGTGFALTVGMLSSPRLPVGALVALPVGEAQSVPLPRGAAPLTLGSTVDKTDSPKGEVWAGTAAPGVFALTVGATARQVFKRIPAHVETTAMIGAPAPPEPGLEALCQFAIKADRAAKILGRALEPGGFLACLAGGDLEGALWTDGKKVRLDVALVR